MGLAFGFLIEYLRQKEVAGRPKGGNFDLEIAGDPDRQCSYDEDEEKVSLISMTIGQRPEYIENLTLKTDSDTDEDLSEE